MGDQRRTSNTAIKHDPLLDEADELIAFLRIPENRDKLEGPMYILAGSLVNRWEWNANKLSDEELSKFAKQASVLVDAIKARASRSLARRSES